jgi:hypothetical protein
MPKGRTPPPLRHSATLVLSPLGDSAAYWVGSSVHGPDRITLPLFYSVRAAARSRKVGSSRPAGIISLRRCAIHPRDSDLLRALPGHYSVLRSAERREAQVDWIVVTFSFPRGKAGLGAHLRSGMNRRSVRGGSRERMSATPGSARPFIGCADGRIKV